MPAYIPFLKPPTLAAHYRSWSDVRAEILQVAEDMDIPLDHAMRYVLEQDRVNAEFLA